MTGRAIDHAILVVDDLDRAAEHLLDSHGLASLPGGRHTGHGTANRIVPLGNTYLELMAVVDDPEAAGSAMGRWALAHRTERLSPAGLCLRTDDAAAEAARLGIAPLAMSRTRPDGVVLSWRLVGAGEMFAGEGVPFFIEWDDLSLYPGGTSVRHRVDARGIGSAVITGDATALSRRIGEQVPGLTIAAGAPAITVTVATAGDPIVL